LNFKYLKRTNDIMCDVLGSWKNNGCHSTWVIVDAYGIAETRGKSSHMLTVMVVFRTVCKRDYVNKASPDFDE